MKHIKYLFAFVLAFNLSLGLTGHVAPAFTAPYQVCYVNRGSTAQQINSRQFVYGQQPFSVTAVYAIQTGLVGLRCYLDGQIQVAIKYNALLFSNLRIQFQKQQFLLKRIYNANQHSNLYIA